MTSEFRKIKNNEDTHYVLETATSGATSAGVVATAPGKRREDSILAQEKKETPKPRNFVAKNAKMGGAGQHKDKKKAAKQGDVKHKKPLAESYAEDLAKQVFDANPNIKDENAVLDAAWPIVVQDLGKKTAMSMFNYDEDFPSDLVSVYGWLQKDQQGVAEGERTMSRAAKGNEKYGKDGMKALAKAGREGASEKKLDAIRDKHNNYNEGLRDPKDNPCWKGYKPVGTKKKAGKTVPNCVPKESIAEGYYDLPNQGNVPGMEPIDFSSKPSFKDLITRYTQLVYQGHASETSPEEDQEYDTIEKYVAQRFGEKGSAHLQKAGEVSYWGRNDKPYGRDSRSSNLGRPNQPSGNFRTTKAGKMHGQDAKMMKAKVTDRLGRHPEPNLPEGFNGEYDDEAGMAQSNLITTARAVMGLLKTIKDRDNLPEWGQEKIAKAEMMLVTVWDYLQSQKQMGNDPQVEAYGRYDRRDAYQRDYDSSVSGMDRGNNHRDDERHDLDPSDWYIVKDGKMYKTSVYPRQEQEAITRGYSRTREEAKAKAEQGVAEVAPPGWEKTVKAMKKHDEIDNPYALAWSMKNKGYKSHKKESADPYFESLRAKVEELTKK